MKILIPVQMRQKLKSDSVVLFSKLKGSDRRHPKLTESPGVNLIGYIRGDFGLGESCRLVAGGLYQSKIPFSIHNISVCGNAPETNEQWKHFEMKDLPYGINLIHLNPDGLQNTVWKLGLNAFRGRYNIGFFLWEQPELPDVWKPALALMDEVWTPAEFISNTIQKYTDKPIYTMPYGLPVPPIGRDFDRKYFGLPQDLCLFLISYDGYSSFERKNPMGSVRAFCRAFSPEDAVGLVIKATHACEEDLRDFRRLLVEYPNIFILMDSYSKVEFNSLVACVDVYVSLHRAEGFGLVMAEAMLLGTAVIATNWSANTEFMNEQVAAMVPAEIITLEQDSFPYEKGSHWAAPDEKAAAVWMRKLYEDPALRTELAEKAKVFAQDRLSPARAARQMGQRLQELLNEEKS